MDHTFRFILEEPSTGSSKGQNNRKRARLVTACDNWYVERRRAICLGQQPSPFILLHPGHHSRLKKIKCIRTAQLDSEVPCEACKVSNTDCSYGDRDRYQNERGLSFASTIPPQPPTPVAPVPSRTTPTEEPGRKRKASIISSPEEQHETLGDTRRNSNAERRPSILTSHNSSQATISANGDGSRRSVISPIQTTAAPASEPVPDPALKRITVPFFRYVRIESPLLARNQTLFGDLTLSHRPKKVFWPDSQYARIPEGQSPVSIKHSSIGPNPSHFLTFITLFRCIFLQNFDPQ